MKAIRRFRVRAVLPAPLAGLEELAHNLRWSWHPPTRAVLADLDPATWAQVGGDPLALLDGLSGAQLDALAADPHRVARVHAAVADLHAYLEQPRWYQQQTGTGLPASIAFFSPDLAATLPSAPGGPDVPAVDHLRAASDLGVPVIGVGLLRSTGAAPDLDADDLPLTLLREADGAPALVTMALPGGRTLHAHVRVARVGRVPLLLLDPGGPDGATGTPGLESDLLLGVGGVRALRAFSRVTGAPVPEVHHVDGGHAAFGAVERVRELVADGVPFATALEVVRATTVLTLHAAVPDGTDRLEAPVVAEHLAALDEKGDLPVDDVVALGTADHPGGDPSRLSTAVLGLRLAGRVNGVSRRHGRAVREAFAALWPGFDPQEVPIGSVTHGVHAATWVAPEVTALAARRMGPQALATGSGWQDPAAVTDAELWGLRSLLRQALVDDVRRRAGDAHAVEDVLSPDVLTIGCAGGATSGWLGVLLADPAGLEALLLDPLRPVQLVVVGTADPADELAAFADQHHVRHRVVVVPHDDQRAVATLYAGCDLWLGSPRPGRDAGSTTGMKVALNGGLHLSVLDGWWDEWHDEDNGWVLPAPDGAEDAADEVRAAALHDVLEGQVVPTFHDRDADGVPHRWLAMVRHALATLGPKVQATRMVADYVAHLYVPAAAAGAALAADDLAGAAALAGWRDRVRAAWPQVRVDHVDPGGPPPALQVGDRLHVHALVDLGDLSPQDVEVQVVHGAVGPDGEIATFQVGVLTPGETDGTGRHSCTGEVELTSTGRFGYTVRVVPRHEALTSVAEAGLVTTAG